jgi:hypothetical protein
MKENMKEEKRGEKGTKYTLLRLHVLRRRFSDAINWTKPHGIYLYVTLEQAIKARGRMRNSCTLSLTSVLYGGEWSMPRPGRFTPVKETLHPLYRMMCESQGRSVRGAENQASNGIQSPDRPASSELLYRLGYTGPRKKNNAQSLFKPIKPAIYPCNKGTLSSYYAGKTPVSITKTNQLFLYKEIIIVCYESHMKHTV